MCLCSCTPCEGIHAQVTSHGGGGGGGVGGGGPGGGGGGVGGVGGGGGGWGGVGGRGGGLSASLPLMTLVSSLLPPKAISLHLVCWRRSFYSFFRFTKETLFRFTLFSCFFTPQRIRLAFAFLFVGEDVSFMSICFFAFNPLKRFRLAFSFLCVGEDVFIHFFTA